VNSGRLLAIAIGAVTVLLIAIGTIHPIPSALAYAGGPVGSVASSESTAEGAVDELGREIKLQAYMDAYNSLANKAEFTEPEFLHDLTGYALSLRTYATLDSFEVQPLHETGSDAEMRLKMHWSSVAGVFDDSRDLKVLKNGDKWSVDWPLVHQQHVPPQVIPVNYLRWDVIRSGEGDDWGTQDVEAPHVRIVDMRPVNRADGVAVMGELLNEDVIPAFVSVRATLVGKNGATIDTEGTFDMIQHTLLPKQVTPFIIHFPDVSLSQVASIRMEPLSVLVAASADPVVEIQNQTFNPSPNPSVTGQLINESGHTVNVAHVLTTLYDKNGQVVWVAGQYIDRALLPQTPVDFRIPLPADLAKQGATVRTVVATYVVGSGL
jgi:hypothetical protein